MKDTHHYVLALWGILFLMGIRILAFTIQSRKPTLAKEHPIPLPPAPAIDPNLIDNMLARDSISAVEKPV